MFELPFEIHTSVTDCRGNVLFKAVVDGADVAGEVYKPGDGTRRRKLAAVWCCPCLLQRRHRHCRSAQT